MPTIQKETPGPFALPADKEVSILQTGGIQASGQEDTILVVAWAHVQGGTGSRSITPRLRRGTDPAGPLVFTGRSSRAGIGRSKRDVVFITHHEKKGAPVADGYALTLEQAAGSADGAATDAGLYVFVVD